MNLNRDSGDLDKLKQRNLWVLFIIGLIHGFGVGMLNVLLQPFILDLTNSILVTGVLISLGGAMQFLPLPLVGKLSDKHGRKIPLLIGIPMYILGLLFFIISNSSTLFFLIIGILFYFTGFTFNGLNRQFLTTENSDKAKGFVYGLMFFSFFAGMIGGSTLIMFNGRINPRFYFTIFASILLIEWIIYFLFLTDVYKIKLIQGQITQHNPSNSDNKIWKKLFQTPKTKVILIFFTLDIFVYSISLSIYTGGLKDQYNFSIEQLAIFSMAFNIANLVTQIPAGKLVDKLGKKKTLILSQLFGLGFFIMNGLAYSLWAIGFEIVLLPFILVAQILIGLSVTTFIPSEQIILTDLDETRKAESYGIVGFIRGIGFMFTGVIGGLLIENVHYLAPFILSAIGVLFEVWYLVKYFHEN
jgi:MFS family permease